MTGPESLHVVSVKAPDTAEAPGGRDEPYDGEDVLSICGMSLSRETRDGRIGRSDPREVFVEQVLSILASEGPRVRAARCSSASRTSARPPFCARLTSGAAEDRRRDLAR